MREVSGGGPIEVTTRLPDGRIDRLIQVGSVGGNVSFNLSGAWSPPDLTRLYVGVFARHRLFAGRDRELGALDRALADAERAGAYVLVLAPAGFGKTALLAAWIEALARRGVHPAYAFINRLAGTDDRALTLRALCLQLAGDPAADVSPADGEAELAARLRTFLDTPPPTHPSVVVIDGLDEATWSLGGILPPSPPPGRMVVLAARPASADWARTLGLDTAATATIDLQAFDAEDVRRLLQAAGPRAAEFAGDAAFVRALHETASSDALPGYPGGDPLFVRLLVEDVRDGRITSSADLARQPAGLGDYFDQWWKEIVDTLTGLPLRDLLGYLLVAKGPIGRAELTAISDSDGLDEFGARDAPSFEDVLRRMRRFLIGEDSGLALGHPRFEQYLRERRFDEAGLAHYRDQLLAYCGKWASRVPAGPYALLHYPEHLQDAGDTAGLVGLLGDPQFVEAKAKACGVDALLDDLERVADVPGFRDEPGSAVLVALGNVLRRARAALARDPGQLLAQVHGRMLGDADPSIVGFVGALARQATAPWLAAQTATMGSDASLDATITAVGTIRALAFGRVGATTLLAIGIDDAVALHDPRKGASELRRIGNEGARVTGVAIGSLAERAVLAVAAGYDGRLVVRDAVTGQQIGDAIALDGFADSVAIGLIGGRAAVAVAGGGRARAWELGPESGAPVALASVGPFEIASVATVGEQVVLVVVRNGPDGAVALHDAATGARLGPETWQGVAALPRAVAVSGTGAQLRVALAWDPALVGLWSGETGEAIGPYLDLGSARVRCVAVGSVAGRPLVAASPDFSGTGVVMLREPLRPSRRARAPVRDHQRRIERMCRDAGGRILAVGADLATVDEVRLDGDEPLAPLAGAFDAHAIAELLGGPGAPPDFTVQADPSGTLRLAEELDLGARDTAQAEAFRRVEPIGWRATARRRALLQGTAVLALGSYGGAVWLWDIRKQALLAGPFADVPEELFVPAPHVKAARPPAVRGISLGQVAGRDALATASGGAVQLWDIGTAQALPAPAMPGSVVTALELGVVGGHEVLVAGTIGGTLALWELGERPTRLAAVTLDAGVEDAWVIHGADLIAALTVDGQLHVFALRPPGG